VGLSTSLGSVLQLHQVPTLCKNTMDTYKQIRDLPLIEILDMCYMRDPEWMHAQKSLSRATREPPPENWCRPCKAACPVEAL